MYSPAPPCSSPTALIVVVVFLIFLLIGMGVLIVILMTRPRPSCPQPVTSSRAPCPPNQVTAPVYVYGFAPGASSREISSTSGVLTPSNETTRLTPLNRMAPQNQQWRLVQRGPDLLLQHVSTSRYLNGNGETTDDPTQALGFNLLGPMRNGRSYYLRSGNSYLATNGDLTVGLIQPGGSVPLNAEWMVQLGTCQSLGEGGC